MSAACARKKINTRPRMVGSFRCATLVGTPHKSGREFVCEILLARKTRRALLGSRARFSENQDPELPRCDQWNSDRVEAVAQSVEMLNTFGEEHHVRAHLHRLLDLARCELPGTLSASAGRERAGDRMRNRGSREMGYGPSEFLRAEGDLPTRRSVCKVMMGLTASERLLFERVIEAAVDEAFERDVELTVTDVTVRLLSAYDRGIRDEEELKNAIVFNGLKSYIH